MLSTPWGDIAVNDAHVHFFSHRFYSGLARQKGLDHPESLGPLLGWEIPIVNPVSLAERWLAELDSHGVSRAGLIASAPGDEDSVAAAAGACPDRFVGYFMTDPLQPDSAERVAAAGRNAHLHCLCLFPAMHRYSIADPRVLPVLETAEAYQLPVFVHCGALSIGVRKKLGLPSPFDMRFSNPLDLHPVALRFPGIRFIVPHFGGGMFREALMLADLCPNVCFDTSSTNNWMKYENLDLRAVFRRSLDILGPRRLLFGSDSSFFPRGWQLPVLEAQAVALYSLGVTADEARQIFSGNFDNLFRFSPVT